MILKMLSFHLGKSVIRGRFGGTVKQSNGILKFEATAHYLLDDEFTDPSGVRQIVLGTSDPDVLPDNVLGDSVLFATDAGGVPYNIVGTWITKITGRVRSAN